MLPVVCLIVVANTLVAPAAMTALLCAKMKGNDVDRPLDSGNCKNCRLCNCTRLKAMQLQQGQACRLCSKTNDATADYRFLTASTPLCKLVRGYSQGFGFVFLHAMLALVPWQASVQLLVDN
jgi:hypothetical protein